MTGQLKYVVGICKLHTTCETNLTGFYLCNWSFIGKAWFCATRVKWLSTVTEILDLLTLYRKRPTEPILHLSQHPYALPCEIRAIPTWSPAESGSRFWRRLKVKNTCLFLLNKVIKVFSLFSYRSARNTSHQRDSFALDFSTFPCRLYIY